MATKIIECSLDDGGQRRFVTRRAVIDVRHVDAYTCELRIEESLSQNAAKDGEVPCGTLRLRLGAGGVIVITDESVIING